MIGTRESLEATIEDCRRYDGGYGAGNLCREGDKYFFSAASEDLVPSVMTDLWSTVEWMNEEWGDTDDGRRWALDWLEEDLTNEGL